MVAELVAVLVEMFVVGFAALLVVGLVVLLVIGLVLCRLRKISYISF